MTRIKINIRFFITSLFLLAINIFHWTEGGFYSAENLFNICPNECECAGTAGKVTINCGLKNLTSIPISLQAGHFNLSDYVVKL